MSFDVFLQRFRPGDPDSEVLVDLVRPDLVASKEGFFDLHFDDGSVAIFGLDHPGRGVMVNHVSGRQSWGVLIEVARQGEMAVLLLGCPAVVTSEDLIPDLPEDLRDDAQVIRTSEDLMRLIETAEAGAHTESGADGRGLPVTTEGARMIWA